MSGEPPITLRAIHDSGGGNLPIIRIVIHTTSGSTAWPSYAQPPSAHGTALYFQNPASGGSAHYVTDTGAEEHCVPDGVIAWHAPPNENSLGIEISGHPDWSRAQWLDPQVRPGLDRAAARCAELCSRFGVPTVRLSVADLLAGRHGICGHVDVSNAWHQTDHYDPGANFPWDYFMSQVTDQEDELADPELVRRINAIYDGLYVGGPSTPHGLPLVHLIEALYDGLYFGGPSTPGGRPLVELLAAVQAAVGPVHRPGDPNADKNGDVPLKQEVADAKTGTQELLKRVPKP